MSIDLSINLNKIALIRNSRPGNYPDVTRHGEQCLALGAQGLTVHPRPDQRHIRPDDVRALALLIKKIPGKEFNIEGNPFAPAKGSYPGLLQLVRETHPDQCTLVPDNDEQATSDQGFDLTQDGEAVAEVIRQLHNMGVRVSLFMDPEIEQIKLAKQIGADRIELYTGPFAEHFEREPEQVDTLFKSYCDAAVCAHQLGLGVNAGHDLNQSNMQLFRQLPYLKEVSIGHALTVEALEHGLSATVQAYLKICSE